MGIVNLDALKSMFEDRGIKVVTPSFSKPGPDLTIGCHNYSIEVDINEAEMPPTA